MNISPDTVILWQWGPIVLNATIVFTWGVMAVLVIASWIITRRLTSDAKLSTGQNLLEIIVSYMKDQIEEITHQPQGRYLAFLGTVFLFISVSNLLSVVPGYRPPTGSLSTTAALATCVFVAVPLYGILQRGLLGYLKHYIRPSVFLLPFQIIGELSRTLALAVRLFGNVMSGTMIGAVLLSVVPFLVPVLMQLLELLIGQIQAYIFAVLAAVYIASATRAYEEQENKSTAKVKSNPGGKSHGK
jgi:F-type H+-transporting ATPase subunit a